MKNKMSMILSLCGGLILSQGALAQSATGDDSQTYVIHYLKQNMTEVLQLQADNSVTLEGQDFGLCHGVASEAIPGNLMLLHFFGENIQGTFCRKLNMSFLYYTTSTLKLLKSMQVGRTMEYGVYRGSSDQIVVEVTRIK